MALRGHGYIFVQSALGVLNFEEATGIDQHVLIQKAGYDATVVGKGREVIIYDPRRIKSMFNQGSYNPFTDDLNANLGLGSNYARRT